MNWRILAMLGLSGAMLMIGCSDDTNGGTSSSSSSSSSSGGGEAGTGGTGGMGTGGMGTGGMGTGGMGTGGSGGGMMCAMTCAEVIGSMGKLPPCPGSTGAPFFDALKMCTCDPNKCQTACMTSACAMPPMPPDTACGMCLQDPAKGCGAEFLACASN